MFVVNLSTLIRNDHQWSSLKFGWVVPNDTRVCGRLYRDKQNEGWWMAQCCMYEGFAFFTQLWTFTHSLNLISALTIWVCCSVGSHSRICWIHHSRIVQSCQGSHLRSRASLLCGQWSVHWALRCQSWWRSLCFCQLRWISWCLASAHSSWSKTSGWKIWNTKPNEAF